MSRLSYKLPSHLFKDPNEIKSLNQSYRACSLPDQETLLKPKSKCWVFLCSLCSLCASAVAYKHPGLCAPVYPTWQTN